MPAVRQDARQLRLRHRALVSHSHVNALASGDTWLAKGANILLLAPSGSGKLHLGAAIGHARVENGYRCYSPAPQISCSGCRLPGMADNLTRYETDRPGIPRKGSALLQGIVSCGRCSRRMCLRYSGPHGDYPVYMCAADHNSDGRPRCQEVRAAEVERRPCATHKMRTSPPTIR